MTGANVVFSVITNQNVNKVLIRNDSQLKQNDKNCKQTKFLDSHIDFLICNLDLFHNIILPQVNSRNVIVLSEDMSLVS